MADTLQSWTLDKASQLVWGVKDICMGAGYILAMYGSVLSGEGRDLDLIAVPTLPERNHINFATRLASYLGAEVIHDTEYKGLLNSYSVILKKNNRIIDLHIKTNTSIEGYKNG